MKEILASALLKKAIHIEVKKVENLFFPILTSESFFIDDGLLYDFTESDMRNSVINFMYFKVEKLLTSNENLTTQDAITFLQEYMKDIDYDSFQETMETFILTEKMECLIEEIDGIIIKN
jgi:hypothetical protein